MIPGGRLQTIFGKFASLVCSLRTGTVSLVGCKRVPTLACFFRSSGLWLSAHLGPSLGVGPLFSFPEKVLFSFLKKKQKTKTNHSEYFGLFCFGLFVFFLVGCFVF